MYTFSLSLSLSLSLLNQDNVLLPLNERWLEVDADFTLSTTSLHAVWPTLRNELYEWAVIKDTSSYDSRPIEAPQEPCQHPSVMQCGRTGND